MKRGLLMGAILVGFTTLAQEEVKKDTTRLNMGKMEIILIDHSEDDEDMEGDLDTLDAAPDEDDKRDHFEAHWAGLDMGFSMLMNNNFNSDFPSHPYWENDPAKSMTWNLNFIEHKFAIAQNYFGVTTGLGFSFTQVAFKDNYVLQYDSDTLFAVIDSTVNYSKNKLRASYLTVPLLLEFCTSNDNDKSFYLAAGVIGGVRMTSRIKRTGEIDGKDFDQKVKGTYGLNSFKLDGTVRLGYGDFGAFASYSLLPLFNTDKTTEVYPLTFGLTLNF